MELEIEGLISEGWKPRIKKRKNRRYITLRKGNNEKSLGPYTDELWEKVKPADLWATLAQVSELEKRISELERVAAKRGKTNHRKKHFPRKQKEELPELHPVIQQIRTLMKSQGTPSNKEALSQAIETQNKFNPYLLNHGRKTPKELMMFFEDKIKKQDEYIIEIQANADRYLDKLIAHAAVKKLKRTRPMMGNSI